MVADEPTEIALEYVVPVEGQAGALPSVVYRMLVSPVASNATLWAEV